MPDAADGIIAGVSTAAPMVGAGLAVAKAISGFFGKKSEQKDMERLQSQVRSYKTPEEIYKIVQAAQNNATSGLDAMTLDYETNQVDRGFSSTLSTIQRMGGDPNSAAGAFDQKIQATMKIGADSHAENMKNFSTYLSSLSVLGDNKAAEQKSEQDILKDKIRAKAGQINESNKDMWNGLNGITGAMSAASIMKMGTAGKVAGAASVGATADKAVGGLTADQIAQISKLLSGGASSVSPDDNISN